jgi:NADH:ubiquinone oxidoreductase subunit
MRRLDFVAGVGHSPAALARNAETPFLLKWLSNNALGTTLHTWWRGQFVGEDEFGNRYYRERRRAGDWRRERRWVVYHRLDVIEPSLVPPGWHAWLHHNLEEPPTEQSLPRQRWEKPYLPNLSGTPQAYLPPGHEMRGGRRDPATGDYEAWRPE